MNKKKQEETKEDGAPELLTVVNIVTSQRLKCEEETKEDGASKLVIVVNIVTSQRPKCIKMLQAEFVLQSISKIKKIGKK